MNHFTEIDFAAVKRSIVGIICGGGGGFLVYISKDKPQEYLGIGLICFALWELQNGDFREFIKFGVARAKKQQIRASGSMTVDQTHLPPEDKK